VLNAGSAPNLIPGTAEAVLDVRMLPGENPDEIIQALKRAMGDNTVAIEIISSPLAGPISSYKTAAFTLWEEILQQEIPGSLVVPLMDIGGSDSKHFRVKGILCYGLVPAVIDSNELASVARTTNTFQN